MVLALNPLMRPASEIFICLSACSYLQSKPSSGWKVKVLFLLLFVGVWGQPLRAAASLGGLRFRFLHCGHHAARNVSILEATNPAPGNGYEGDKAVLLPPNLNRRRLQKLAQKEVMCPARRMVHKCSKGKCPVQSDAAAARPPSFHKTGTRCSTTNCTDCRPRNSFTSRR
jgi:hypothetical protein